MVLHVRYRYVDATPELDALVTHRVQLALSRFTDAIRTTHVTLTDINGPRGGIDKTCRIRITGPQLGSIIIEDAAADLGRRLAELA